MHPGGLWWTTLVPLSLLNYLTQRKILGGAQRRSGQRWRKIDCIPCWGRKRAKKIPWIIVNHEMFLPSGRPSRSSDVCGTRAKSGKERGVVGSRYLNPCKAVIGRLTELPNLIMIFSTTSKHSRFIIAQSRRLWSVQAQALEETLSPWGLEVSNKNWSALFAFWGPSWVWCTVIRLLDDCTTHRYNRYVVNASTGLKIADAEALKFDNH